MALINQNSIIGLTSITSPSSSNVLTVHTNDTTERLRVSTSGLSFSGTNASLDTSGNISAVDGTFTGNVSIGGTLTYEDVTNIDAVGIITAQAGIRVTGGSVGIGTDNPSNYGGAVKLALNSSGHTGLTIAAGTGSDSNIFFADGVSGDATYRGNIKYAHNGDSMRFHTAAEERLRVTSAGLVGIGTDIPENGLHVSDGSSFAAPQNSGAGRIMIEHASSSDLQFMTANSGYNHIFFGDQDDANIGSIVYHHNSNTNALVFNVNTSERLRITSSGTLQVASGGNLQMSSTGRIFVGNGGNATNPMFANVSDTNTGIAFPAADTMMFTTGGGERLRITSGGNVGINRVDPDQKLNVNGNIEVNAYDSASGSGGYYTAKGLIIGNLYDAGKSYTGSDDRTGCIWQERGLDLDFATNDSLRMKITYDGKVGINETSPSASLDVKGTVSAGAGTDEDLQQWNIGSNNVKAEIKYVDAAANRGMLFGTTTDHALAFQTNNTERLSITSNGIIRKGNSNSTNDTGLVELFFQKRGTQIGKRIHQGSGGSSTTHNILNIASWQSTNSHLFAYVTVYYVSPVSNYGGKMEAYAHAVNSGGNVSGGQGTFVVADAGRWGNPGTMSLSWSGSTLRLNTFATAYIDYSVDITYIAYDGAVVSFYGN